MSKGIKLLIISLGVCCLISAKAYAQEYGTGSAGISGTPIHEFSITSGAISFTDTTGAQGPQEYEIGTITFTGVDNNFNPAVDAPITSIAITAGLPNDRYGTSNTYELKLGEVSDATQGTGNTYDGLGVYGPDYSGGRLTLDGTTRHIMVIGTASTDDIAHRVVSSTQSHPLYLSINDGARIPASANDSYTLTLTSYDE